MREFLAKLCKKNGIAKRIFSMALAILMMSTTIQALPAGILTANASENTYGVTLHFQESTWTANSMYAYAWNSSDTYVSDAWPGNAMSDEDADGWYDVTFSFTESQLSGGNLNFKFTDNNENESSNNLNYQLTAGQTTELWVYNGKDATNGSIVTAKPTGSSWTGNITMHYKNTDSWSNVYVYMWDGAGTLNGAWSGNQTGAVLPAQSENETNKSNGWWDVTFNGLTLNDGLLRMIFNDSSSQSMDLYFVPTGTDAELWITGGKNSTSSNIKTVAPTDWTTDTTDDGSSDNDNETTTKYDVTIHCDYASNNWSESYAYAFVGDTPFGATWPGTQMTTNAKNTGWRILLLAM